MVLPGIGRSAAHHLISLISCPALLCFCLTRRHSLSGCQPGILSAVPLCRDADLSLIKCLWQRVISHAQAPRFQQTEEGVASVSLAMHLAVARGIKGLLGQSNAMHGMCQCIDDISP